MTLAKSLLPTIVCPEIEGQKTQIDKLFRSPLEIEANRKRNVASFLVVGDVSRNEPVVLQFFSIRAGELFRQYDYTPEQIELAFKVYEAIRIWYDKAGKLTDSEKLSIRNDIENIKAKGIDFETVRSIVQNPEYKNYKKDVREEPTEDIHRVLEVFSGIELKLFGNNAKAKDLWNSFNMPRKMGETLFWKFLIPKIEEARNLIGIEYLYLFAADQTSDERLINYYQSRLHLNGDGKLAANKPSFDNTCRFFYQRMDELVKEKEKFFQNFNPDADTEV